MGGLCTQSGPVPTLRGTARREGIAIGQTLKLEAAASKPSPKGVAAHEVLDLVSLLTVDDRQPRTPGLPKTFKARSRG